MKSQIKVKNLQPQKPTPLNTKPNSAKIIPKWVTAPTRTSANLLTATMKSTNQKLSLEITIERKNVGNFGKKESAPTVPGVNFRTTRRKTRRRGSSCNIAGV